MRIRRQNFLLTTAICLVAALAFAGSALADAGSGDTTSPAATDTKTPVDTSTSKPPTNTSAPKTEVPPPAPPKTQTPVTTTTPPATSPGCTTTSSGTACEGPNEPELPQEPKTCADTPNAAECIPDTPGEFVPQAPGGGELPFTGPGDVVLAIVLALLAGTGGVLFLLGAAGREQLDGLSRRGMDSPSGFHVAYRELRKQQLRD